MKVSEVMTRDVITVRPDTTVRDIAALMVQSRISGVPVVDGEGRLTGILSETDLLHRAETGTERRRKWWLGAFVDDDQLAREYAAAHARRADDIMTRQIVTVDPDADLAFVADLLDRRKLKRLPVVKDGRVVGMITRGDMVRALVMSQSALKAPIPRDEAELVNSINERMRNAKWLDSSLVSVSVKDGVVELMGLVASPDQRRALRVLVEDAPGVVRVDDKMRTKPLTPMV